MRQRVNVFYLALIAVFFAAIGVTNVNGEAIVLTDETFFNSVKSGVWFVEFYAPWCPHCKGLAPTWDELATKATDFKVAKVDCENYRTVCDSMRVAGFPTLFLFSGPVTPPYEVERRAEKFSGTRDVDTFLKWVQENAKPTDSTAEVVSKSETTSTSTSSTPKKTIPTNIEPADVPALDITSENISQIKKGAWFVEFYAPWCGYCKKLAPIYAEFAEIETEKGDFKVAKVNCDDHKDICREYGVAGFPTLKFFLEGVVHDHVGAQSVAEMGQFARGIMEDAKRQKGDVIVLTANNFERQVLSKDGSWMIDFYAPWCGHCKDMAPSWEEFAKGAKENGDSIHVAKVDCDENEALCERFGLSSYPTIKLIQVKTYPANKDRNAAGFQQFWERFEGTYSGGASDVVVLTGENFKSKTKNGLWLIDYYAPWCGHCKQFAPVLEEIATSVKGNFYVGKIDCEGKGNERLCDDIEFFPTLAAWRDGKKLAVYNADRNQQMLVDWMESFEDEIPEDEEEVTDVATLTPENFKRRLSEGNWIVDFYAPWCGHCKQLAPVWEELAMLENPAGRVTVGRMDCSRYADFCKRFDLTSYPTIAFFKNGKEKQPRFGGGERSLAKFQAYIDQFVPRAEGKFDDVDIL